ncbi:MAG: hypothetical protein IKW24_02810 [Clostridia bacterium]|nr:hypothetical protein [Clostridia bacterium]
MDQNFQSQNRYSPYTPQNQEGFNSPPQQNFNSPDMQGSVQKVLTENIGQYVVMEFLVGSDTIVRKQGILYFVGTSYVVLFDDVIGNYIVCDLYSIKFTYFYYPGQRPSQNFNSLSSNFPQN